MSTPQLYDFEGNNVRIVMIDGDPWFVAGDVCKVLGYANTSDAIAKHVDPEDKASVSLGLRGSPPITLNESGLYSLILTSHKPEAKRFKRWVTSEVLPSIRKHGMYAMPEVAREATEDPTLFLARAVVMANEQIARLNAEKAEINNRKTATAMGKLGGTVKAKNALARKVAALQAQIGSVPRFASVDEVPGNHSPAPLASWCSLNRTPSRIRWIDGQVAGVEFPAQAWKEVYGVTL